MKAYVRLVWLIILLAAGANAQWIKTTGPEGGPVNCFTVSGGNLFAGTAGGGVFLSTNSGSSWTSASSGLGVYQIQALIANGGNLIAGTWGGGMYLSTNNGASWSTANNGLGNGDIRALTASGTSIFAGTYGGGVYITTDGGASWTSSDSGLTNSVVWALAANGSDIFAGTDGGVFLSTDAGGTWNATDTVLKNQHVISFTVTVSYVFAGTAGGGVYRTTDNGQHWNPVNQGLTIPQVYSLVASGENLLAGTWGGVFLSSDQGSNWTLSNSGLTSPVVRALATSGSDVFAGTNGGLGVYRSTDNGASWSGSGNGLSASTVRAVATNPAGIYAGTSDHGIYLSSDNGANWAPVNTGLTNKSIRSILPEGSNLFAGTEGGGVYLSSDNGGLWAPVNSGMTATSVRALAVLSSGGGLKLRKTASPGGDIFAGTGAGVFRSSDNGSSWSAVNTGLTSLDILSLASSGTNLFAGTNGSGVFLSSNSGGSWSAVITGLGELHVRALALVAGELFAGTDGGVFASTDNGGVWSAVNSGLTSTQVLSFSVSGTNLFAGTLTGGVFLLTYKNTLWSPVAGGLTDLNVQGLAIGPSMLFAGTNSSSVWRRPLSEMITTQFSLTLIAVNGSVAKAPDQIVYDSMTVVELTPSANAGYHFVDWSGDVTGSAVPAPLTMNGNKTVTANFALNQFSLTVNALHGTVTRNPNLSLYDSGSVVELQEHPDPGYHFVNWTGDVSDTASTVYLTMNGERTVTANFALNQYHLTVNAPNGSVTRNPSLSVYDSGTVVHLTAVPAAGYHFANWSGDLSGPANPDSIVMNSEKTVTAHFALNQFTLTVNAPDGSVTRDPSLSVYDSGTVVHLTAVPAAGYHFVSWSGDLSGPANPDSIIMNSDKTVTATFTINQFALTVNGPNGTVIRDPDRSLYDSNTVVRLTAVPATGYRFVNWSGDLTGDSNPDSVRMTGEKTVTAHFTIKQYTLSLTAEQGSVSRSPELPLYDSNTVVHLTAVPATGYRFVNWSGDLTGSANPDSVRMSGNKSIVATFEVLITVGQGWNMVSAPVGVSDARRSSLFPGAASPAFAYENGYTQRDTLRHGWGYWLKFAGDGTIVFPGTDIFIDTVNLLPRWNMIGSVARPLPISWITSDPPGMVLSQFFCYRPDSGIYSVVDTLMPGKGFWVKAPQAGRLFLAWVDMPPPPPPSSKSIRIAPTEELPPPPPDGKTEQQRVIPKEFALLQNYPNPFNPGTTIRFDLPKDTRVDLKVYDVLGRMVATLAEGERKAGEYSIRWDARSVPSGLYFYRLVAGDFVGTKKLLVLK